MIIVVNRDGTIATVTPSVVYQGSNQASELAVFAPFSVASYSAVTANVELPNGEILPPILVLPTETQPTGFGAWSALLKSSVTALSGTVKVSVCFYGSGYTINETTGEVEGSGIKIPTETAEITVRATVPSLPVEPNPNIYEQILSAYSALVTDFDYFSKNIQTNNIYTNRILVVNDTGAALQVPSEGGTLFAQRPYIIADTPDDGFSAHDILNYEEIIAEIDKLSIAYNNSTGVLYLKNSEGEVIGEADLPTERILDTAAYSNGYLVLTFTNGDTVSLPLEDLILPTWTTNINTTDASAKIIPPTTQAVKEYVDTTAANVLKNTVSGRAVLTENISANDSNILISSIPAIPGIAVFARNILNAQSASPATASTGSVIYNSPGNITWTAGSAYYVKIPVHIPSGCVVSFSIKYAPNGNNSGDAMGRVRFSTSNLNEYVYSPTQTGATSGTFVVPDGKTVEYMQITKYSGASTPLVDDVVISEICVNLANEAVYTEYDDPGFFQYTVSETPEEAFIHAATVGRGGATIFPYDPSTSSYINDATLTVEYAQDSNKVIEKLQRQIAALQNAIAT